MKSPLTAEQRARYSAKAAQAYRDRRLKEGHVVRPSRKVGIDWKDREARRQYLREWSLTPRGKAKKLQRDWRVAIVNTLMELQNGKCAYCRSKLKSAEIDHIVPLSRGGKHALSNLQLTCKDCNQVKRARYPVEFAQSLGRLL